MKIDLHNHSLEEAEEEICYSLEECQIQMDSTLEIIHGHKHGTAIRDYNRSNRFLNDTAKLGHAVNSKNFSDDGKTRFQIKLNKIQKIEKNDNLTATRTDDCICHKCSKVMIPVEGLNWIKCPICGKFQKR